ncbi:MAG: Bug family tripartite tricarboxylate transporter substrate binding protein [Phreatobacter sp.]
MDRRQFIIGAAGAAVAGPAHAQAFPSRPIIFIVPYSAGGPLDATARMVGEGLARRLGQGVVIENRTGASGMLGANAVARAEPDGHTVLFTVIDTQVNNVALFKNIAYDPIKDFAPITQAFLAPMILVTSAKFTAKTPQEFAAQAKASGQPLSFGSWGIGGSAHLAGEALWNRHFKLNLAHVPYRGEAPIVNDLIANQIAVSFASIANTRQHIEQGALRALAVSGLRRSPALPDLPTLTELGLDDPVFKIGIWLGAFAPGRTPRPIVDKLATEMRAVVRGPDVAERMGKLGFEPIASSPDEFAASLEREIVTIKAVFRDLGIEQQ